MADGTLTFVVPVRDPLGVGDWATMRALMADTLQSLAAAGGRIVVAASRGTDLPPLPPGSTLVELDFDHVPLPPDEGPERHRAVRQDKGARTMHGLVAVQPRGHVMVVDYDDFVSRHLAELVASQADRPGWFVDHGYLFDGGPLVLEQRTGFNRMCGTSLIVRADLLRVPARVPDLDEAWTARALGSHIYLRSDLAAEGMSLAPTPFPGAVYRIGHRDSTSPTTRIARHHLSPRTALRRPADWFANLARLRRAAPLRHEFTLPHSGEG